MDDYITTPQRARFMFPVNYRRSSSTKGVEPFSSICVLFVVAVAFLLPMGCSGSNSSTISSSCLCSGLSSSGLVVACNGIATSQNCRQTAATTLISFSASNVVFSNATSSEVVAEVSGLEFSSSDVTLSVDLCSPSNVITGSGQQRFVIRMSNNVFLGSSTLGVVLINSCSSPSLVLTRSTVFDIQIINNNFTTTFNNKGGGGGVIAVAGLLTYGHWVTIASNTGMINAVRVVPGGSGPVDTNLTGVNLQQLVFASRASSSQSSGGGADWSWPQVAVENNTWNLTQVVTNTGSPQSLGVVGVSLSTDTIPVGGRVQVLANVLTLNLSVTNNSVPSLFSTSWGTDLSTLANPAEYGDYVVGISFNQDRSMSVLSGGVFEIGSNVIRAVNERGCIFGLWLGTANATATTAMGAHTWNATAPVLAVRQDARLLLLSNQIWPSKPLLSRFLFAVVVSLSLDIASQDALGSGTVRIEFNHLVNVDKSYLTSGGGVILQGPQLLVGYNSLFSLRANRMYGFPVIERINGSSSTWRGGVFVGLSFVPYRLSNGSVVSLATQVSPLRVLGVASLVVMDGNIVYIFLIEGAIQPAILFRGIRVEGDHSSVRITQNYLKTFSQSNTPALRVGNITKLFGSVVVQGSFSAWSFARNVVDNGPDNGGVIELYASDETSVPSSGSFTTSPSAEVHIGCTVSGIFSEDSFATPGSLINYRSGPSLYSSKLVVAPGMADDCSSCRKSVMCFAPGTVDVVCNQLGDSLSVYTCRCGLGYSYSRQCGPPQGLHSRTISITNGTLELTLTDTESQSRELTLSTTKSRGTRTHSISITNSSSNDATDSETETKTDSITITTTQSPCYNITSWNTTVDWPFAAMTPNYYFGNITYASLHVSPLVFKMTIHPPVRLFDHVQDWNMPNWNSPIYNYSVQPMPLTKTPPDALTTLVSNFEAGTVTLLLQAATITSSKYIEVHWKWHFVLVNAVCPTRPYVFDVEMRVVADTVWLANETRDVVAAAMFIAGIQGNGAMAALLARAPMITGVIACWGPMAAYDDTVSTTFFRFGTAQGQYARGGVVGNIIAVSSVLGLYLVGVFVLSTITHVDSYALAVRNALEAMHVKSCTTGAVLCVLQPTLSASIGLLRNPVDPSDQVVGGVGVALTVIYAILVTVKVFRFSPDVVLVYDLVRPHMTPPSKIRKFIRYAFWPKYHFLTRDDLRRKIERMLLEDDASNTKDETAEADKDASQQQDTSNPPSSQPPLHDEEKEEDNDKLLGLLKMSAAEYNKSRRWERPHLGDVLIIPPCPEKKDLSNLLMEEAPPKVLEDVVLEEEPLLDINMGAPENLIFTDVARQVETEASYEMMFNAHGNFEEDTLGLGIITEEERLKALQAAKVTPMNFLELQKLEREAEKAKAKEEAKSAREAKIAEIKENIARDLAERKNLELEEKRKAEERVMVPLQILELMRLAKPDKHEWHYLLRGWSDARYAMLPYVSALALGIAHGFADDHCLPSMVTLVVVFVLEVVALGATKLQALVLPFHRVWVLLALLLGFASSVALIVGQEADKNVSLDVAGGFACAYSVVLFLQVVIDAIRTLVHMRVNGEKVMSLIARGQDILADEEIALHYVPPPIPERKPPKPIEPAEELPPPRARTPPPPAPIIAAEEEDEDPNWMDDPDRILNPLGEDEDEDDK